MMNEENFVETVRRMRTFLPLSPSLLEWVQEHYREAPGSAAHLSDLALVLRYLGAPPEVPSSPSPEVMTALFGAVDRLGGPVGASSADLLKFFGPLMVQAKAAKAFGPQFVVHRLHPTAVRAVRETDLAFWPSSPPRALTRPLLVQATPDKGDGTLLGPVNQLLVVPESSGITWICACVRSVGVALHALRAAWSISEDSPDDVRRVLDANLAGISRISMKSGDLELNTAALLKFVVTLALFLEAETCEGRQLASVRTEAGTLPNGRPPKKGQGFTIRHVRISDEALLTASRQFSNTKREAPPHSENLVAEEITVRGFLRRQVCGKGRAERKTIYVAPFRRLQWKARESIVCVR